MAPAKPEAALSKAKELINVNKKVAAIEVLSECIKLQKKNKAWVKTHEEVMMLLAELCVECKKSMTFKETVHQYKNLTFQMNPKSLEDVVKCYLLIAKKATEDAREKSHQLVSDIEDLDNPDTPESLILNAVNLEDEQDRQDRAILTPWLKFLWESYRQCLELLRNNVKFERLYHDIAQEAYEFCRKYDRKTEFRKLCDILRMHMVKYQNNLIQPATTQQTTTETWGFHLETRLKQLDHAIKFELYTEAYKAVEDVWHLLSSSNVGIRPRIYANYYMKTASVLFESGKSYLFHAAALHRLYFYSKENKKNMSEAERESLATRMIVATLAVPLPNNRDPVDPLLESGENANPVKQKTLSMLLHLPSPPTREKLVKEIESNRVYDWVNPQLAALFKVLEYEYKPLAMAKVATPMLSWLEQHPDLYIYGPLIKDILVSKTLIQVGKVYKTIKVVEFEKLCPYVDGLSLLRIVTNVIRNLELPIRIDYRDAKVLKFDVYTDLGISQRADCSLVSGDINGLSSLAKQLSKFSSAMYEVANFIGYVDTEKRENREWICQSYLRTVAESHQLIIDRKSTIENRKEEIERFDEESRQKAKDQKNLIYERRVREENNRLREESEQMERKKIEGERAAQQGKIMKAKINFLKSSEAGSQLLKNYSEKELEGMDDLNLWKMQHEEKNRMKEEQDEAHRRLWQKVDYLQRAVRLEEMALVREAQAAAYQRAQRLHGEKEARRHQEALKAHELRLKQRDMVACVRGDIEAYKAEIEAITRETEVEEEARWRTECAAIIDEFRARRTEELLAERLATTTKQREEDERREAIIRHDDEERQRRLKEEEEEAAKKVVAAATAKTYVPPHLRAQQAAVARATVVKAAEADWRTVVKRH